MKILRTGAILIVMSVVLVVAGGYVGGRGGMQIALVIAVVMNFVSYFFSDKIALRSSGAQPVTREQLPRLYQVMERLASKASLLTNSPTCAITTFSPVPSPQPSLPLSPSSRGLACSLGAVATTIARVAASGLF